MKTMLFTLPTCPSCPPAKDLLELKGIDFEYVDASTSDGMKLAQKYGVGKVPALIIIGEDGDIKDSARGFNEIDALISHE